MRPHKQRYDLTNIAALVSVPSTLSYHVRIFAETRSTSRVKAVLLFLVLHRCYHADAHSNGVTKV